jgi:hypothetical protein
LEGHHEKQSCSARTSCASDAHPLPDRISNRSAAVRCGRLVAGQSGLVDDRRSSGRGRDRHRIVGGGARIHRLFVHSPAEQLRKDSRHQTYAHHAGFRGAICGRVADSRRRCCVTAVCRLRPRGCRTDARLGGWIYGRHARDAQPDQCRSPIRQRRKMAGTECRVTAGRPGDRRTTR